MENLNEPYANTKRVFSKYGLSIRPSTDDDLFGIKQVKFAAFEELCPHLISWYGKHPETLEEEFYGPGRQDPDRRVFYTVQTPDGTVAGCGGLVQKNPQHNPDIGELTDIYLLAEHRGKGLGRAIVSDLIWKAKTARFNTIFLTTRTEFKTAIQLYTSIGFCPVPNDKYKSKNSIAFELALT